MKRQYNLLRTLYEIYSGSGKEQKMKKFLKNFLKDKVLIEEDKKGNMYITKGVADTYPCVAAHLDQVQKPYPKGYSTHIVDGYIIGWSSKYQTQCGLGADDKNGIYIALKMLQEFESIKVAFFVEEEIGTVGSDSANLEWFNDVRFIIEPDRKGGNDLITTMGATKVASDEFIDIIRPITNKYGFKDAIGSLTDVRTLVENGVGISGINISCGYYNPHTEEECTNIADLENTINCVRDIIASVTDRYEYTYDVPSHKYYFNNYENNYDRYYGDLYDEHYEDSYDIPDYIDVYCESMEEYEDAFFKLINNKYIYELSEDEETLTLHIVTDNLNELSIELDKLNLNYEILV